MHKILLACPVSDAKEYVIHDWIAHIKKLSYPVDVLLVDNSKTPGFVQKISKDYNFNSNSNLNIVHILYKNEKDSFNRHRMANAMEFIKNIAIQKKYDYLFSLECDVFPPKNIVERLLKIKNDVAAALYFINHGADSQLMLQKLENPKFGNDTIVRLFTQNEGFLFADGTTKYVFSPGLGCVLINTDILKKIKFRVEDTNDGYQAHHDFFFYKDLYSMQIPVKVDTSIICKHFNGSWLKVLENEKR